MGHSRVYAALTLLSFACVTGGARAALQNNGNMKFEDSSFDFGEVYRGTALTHRFKFINAGDGPLTMQGVHAACGCTAVEIEKGKSYAPGESGFVEVKLDTTDFAGTLVKTVTVMSSEKLLPDRTLTMKAYVKTELEASPPLADFGDVPSMNGATTSITIKPLGGFKLEVKDLVFNKDALEATVVKKDANEYTLTLKVKPGLKPGFLKEQVIVRNNSAHLPEMPVPVRATVKGNIDYAPAYLEFGAIAPKDNVKRSITMKGLSDFQITGTRTELIINGRKIDDAARFIHIETLAHEKEKKLVAVELRNAAQVAGSVHGKLVLTTSDPEQKELAVDFYAFFR